MTILDPSLHDALRTLKLTGMLETLDARLAQTRAGTLGHLEFLQVLCEDEIARRETAALTRRIRRAKFEEQVTLEGFDFTANPKVPAAQIRDLAALRWLAAGESVILFGPVGVGKTHVAQALGHLVARRGGEVRFAKTSRVLADLAGGHADRTWGARVREYTRPAVLILDDYAPPGAHRRASRRPLRAHLRPSREPPPTDPHQQPQTARLVPAVPEPRRRRITARPAHQHQPPDLHGRPVLPAPQTPRPRRLDTTPGRRVDLTNQAPPGELREHHPWGIA